VSTLGSIAVVGRNIAALAPAMALVFDGISLKDGSVITAGKLRVASAAVDWSSADQGAASDVSIASGDMSEMQWVTSFGGRSQLRCRRADGQTLRFVGMWDPEAYTQLAYFVKENYSLELKKAKLATKGWNWGSAVIEGRTMSFQVDGREAFDIPLEKVSQVQEAKHEVALEFHLDESEQKQNEEQLVEMRFFVPPTQPKSTENGDTNPELTPAQELLAKVRDRADITSLERDGFVQFKQINFVTPRCVTRKCKPLALPRPCSRCGCVGSGKYDMEMFDEFLTLRGQSYSYKIPYSNVSRLFLLPRPGQTMLSFVISVNNPIRQGKTGYSHLITQFPAHDEITVDLNIPEETLQSSYGGKLEKEMTGATYEVVTKVFKALSGKRMTIPKGFRSARGDSSVSCAVGNQDGQLYVLDKGFMFVNKPAMNLPFNEVESVDVDRTSDEVQRRALKSWDLTVSMRNSSTKHTFTNLERNDYDPVVAFLKSKGVKLIGAHDQPTRQQYVESDEDEDDEDEEDEDFQGGAPSSDDDDYGEDGGSSDEDAGSDDDTAVKSPASKQKRSRGSADKVPKYGEFHTPRSWCAKACPCHGIR
jgi:structure-specific recognition protein 1